MRLDLAGDGPRGIFHDPRAKLLVFTAEEEARPFARDQPAAGCASCAS